MGSESGKDPRGDTLECRIQGMAWGGFDAISVGKIAIEMRA